MILSSQSIRDVGIFTPFHERTEANGMTFGLGPAGYDVRIAEPHFLPSQGFLLASISERIVMPANVMGIVHDKSTWARRGVFVGNTVIEPGWQGFLTLEIVNNSTSFVRFYEGMPIAQIVLHRLDQTTDQPYAGRYQNQPAGPQAALLNGSLYTCD